MEPTTFADLGCSEPILAALTARGFVSPTPVQAECFGPGLEGRDLLVQSRTGSGKTLAFGLPILHRLAPTKHPQVLVLTPTRELAQQVAAEIVSVSPRLDIAELVGGMDYMAQFRSLHRGARLIVGTPGRVMDHLEKKSLDLSKISMVVLDECDEMLKMGFIDDVEQILANAPVERQTYLFSATLPRPIAALAERFMREPHKISLGSAGGATQHADISHTPCLVPERLQMQALVNFLLHDEPERALIFTRRKIDAEDVAEALRESGLAAEHLHGDLAQGTRSRILASFKQGTLRFLVATDVAARGIDIEGLPLVVHMGIPNQLEGYIHRSGRTGRAGAKGTSLALVDPRESRIMHAWSYRGGLKFAWRFVPNREEIATARAERLQQRLDAAVAPRYLALANKLLQDREPSELVAALLSMQPNETHLGFELPKPSRPREALARPRREWHERPRDVEPRRERRPERPERAERGERPAVPPVHKPQKDREHAPEGGRREPKESHAPHKPAHKNAHKPAASRPHSHADGDTHADTAVSKPAAYIDPPVRPIRAARDGKGAKKGGFKPVRHQKKWER